MCRNHKIIYFLRQGGLTRPPPIGPRCVDAFIERPGGHRRVDLVRDVFARGKVVAAICHGGWMLVSADVLRGRKATCFFAIKDDLVNAGALYEDREVVRDGNLVTSRKPEDLPAFCRTILQALSGAK